MSSETPVADGLTRAVECLQKGSWQEAHELVQGNSSPLASWVHGIVHIMEGDADNARGWYKRADREFPGMDALQSEIAEVSRTIVAR